jgi:Flp pilus assembly secretin CpaC
MKEGNSSNEAESPISSAFRLVFGSTKGLWNADVELLQSNGMARVLAEPTLVALSGQSASFLAGGELPILEPQGLGTTTITYKPFGIGLTVTPTVLAPNRIALKVAPEASDLDYSNAIVLNNVQIPRSPPAAPTPPSSWVMARASSSAAWSAPTSSPTSARFRCWATCRSSARSSATSTTSARTRSW